MVREVTLLFSLLGLLAVGLKQLAVGEKSLAGDLGPVLEPDPVPYLMVSQRVLQVHKFKHLVGFGVGEFTFGDKSSDMGVKGMDTVIRELEDIGEEFIIEVPVMVLGLAYHVDGIQQLPGYLLTPQSICAIVVEGLECLLLFTLDHDLQLLPSNISVISFFSINVKDFKVTYGSGVEDFQVL